MTKRMSESGTCIKALTAVGLGYEPIKKTNSNEESLRYYTMLEAVAAQQMIDYGFAVVDGGECETCLKHNDHRMGFHVELKTTLFDMIGHLDRRVILNDNKQYPVEIKSIGRFTWQKMANSSVFSVYPEYAAQEACYLEAEQLPGLYWVMNRDTGEPLRYIVNDYKHVLTPDIVPHFDQFMQITLPITYDKVIDNLNDVELYIQDKELPNVDIHDGCQWCKFRYLCVKDEDDSGKELSLPDLIDAAEMYKKGIKMEKEGEQMKEAGKFALTKHAKSLPLPENKDGKLLPTKFRVSGVSVSYRGTTYKTWLDEKTIRAGADKELIRLAERKSDPYPDITIRTLKEKKDE